MEEMKLIKPSSIKYKNRNVTASWLNQTSNLKYQPDYVTLSIKAKWKNQLPSKVWIGMHK